MSNTPRLIERNGNLYMLYAGPWINEGPGKRATRVDHQRPHDMIEHCFADGTFSVADKPIVYNGAVYIKY